MQRRLAAILAADVVGYSRLMGVDEMGTLTALKSHRRELVDCGIAEHHGRIVKTTGDGMLVEFASVVDAVACAVKVQRNMVRRNVSYSRRKANRVSNRNQRRRYHHRWRRYIWRRRQYRGPSGNALRTRRRMYFKGGERPDQGQAIDGFRRSRRAGREEHLARGGRVRAHRQGYCSAFRNRPIPSSAEDDRTPAIRHEQEIHFCQTTDGVQLAYSRIGQGPPLVKTGHWMTHIEFDLESPIWRHLYRELSRDHSFIRYDARGNGLSDREVPT